MPVLVFLLIGAVWAAFLLPSFFEGRRRAPISATKSFKRSNELLGSVAVTDTQQIIARRRQALRRRRLLLILSFGAVITLAMAIWTGSFIWLGAAVMFDLLIGAYVTLLLMARQRAFALTTAPRIGTVDAPPASAGTTLLDPAQPSTVRVVAG